MARLIDGSLSTLAPIFAVVFATHQPHYAFLAGLATAIGAGVSMAISEGLSDTGDLTGRGRPSLRGAITGVGTFLGGVLHTLPFLIPQYRPAVLVALAAIAFELLTLAWIRRRFSARLPQLARLGHARRGDHRYDQRRAGCSQVTTGDNASARHKDLTCTPVRQAPRTSRPRGGVRPGRSDAVAVRLASPGE